MYENLLESLAQRGIALPEACCWDQQETQQSTQKSVDELLGIMLLLEISNHHYIHYGS